MKRILAVLGAAVVALGVSALPAVGDTPGTAYDGPSCQSVGEYDYSGVMGSDLTIRFDSQPCTPLHVISAGWTYDFSAYPTTPPVGAGAIYPQNLQTANQYTIDKIGTTVIPGVQVCGQDDFYVSESDDDHLPGTLTAPGTPYEPPFVSDRLTGHLNTYSASVSATCWTPPVVTTSPSSSTTTTPPSTSSSSTTPPTSSSSSSTKPTTPSSTTSSTTPPVSTSSVSVTTTPREAPPATVTRTDTTTSHATVTTTPPTSSIVLIPPMSQPDTTPVQTTQPAVVVLTTDSSAPAPSSETATYESVSPLASTGGGPLSGLIVAGVAILVVGIMALVAARRRPRKS